MNPTLPRTLLLALVAPLALVALVAAGGCQPDEIEPAPATLGPEDGPAGVGVSPIPLPPGEPDAPFDWLIRGGEVIDGTGAPPVRADLLVRGERIAHIGIVDPDTLEVLEHFDATGLVLTPGFIDLHAHGSPLQTPDFENFVAQGVTTIVLGQDGSSPQAAELAGEMRAVEAAPVRVNTGWLIGHNTLRRESGVGFDPPSEEGTRRMAELVGRALEAGAFGLSLGLEYTPGNQADLDELVAIARPVAARGGVVMSHMRTEDSGEVLGAVEELLEQGRRSGARVHVSHLKIVLGSDPAEARRVLAAMEKARAAGLAVSADLYPYTASFTGLAILFPDWARPPNDYDRAVRERGEELAAHLRARVLARNGPGATFFGTGPHAGRTLEEAAESRGIPFEELLVELGPGGARAAYFVMDEGVMATFLADPWVAVASDGSPTMGHPRGYGSFARILHRWVAAEGLLTLEEAVRRMSGLPASILGLADAGRTDLPRGLLGEGWAADLALFDPAAVRDRADFEDPHRIAEGVSGVWVGGRLTWRDGALVPGVASGRVLRDAGSGDPSVTTGPGNR